jgi:hypothetical protein
MLKYKKGDLFSGFHLQGTEATLSVTVYPGNGSQLCTFSPNLGPIWLA